MPFTTTLGPTIRKEHILQIMYAWMGQAGYGVPLVLNQISDSSQASLTVRNQNSSGGHLKVYHSDTSAYPNPIFSVTDSGTNFPSNNVGIGTSSPTEKLSVLDGNFVISKTSYGGFLKWTQGTTSPKAGNWEWGDGTGWRMDFGPSATPRLSIFDNGNVGIGTSSPAYKLDVAGDIRLSNNNALHWSDSGGTGRRMAVLASSGHMYLGDVDNALTGGWLYVNAKSSISLRTNNTERMIIDSSGNVGIGITTSAGNLLDVNGNITIRDAYYLNFGNPGSGDVSIRPTGSGGARGMSFYTYNGGASRRMDIDTNGNVGIGTTSPAGKLHVWGDSYLGGSVSGNTAILLRNLSGVNRIDSYDYPITQNYPLSIMGSYIALQTTDTERVRINNNGVGIGTTTPEALLHTKATTQWVEHIIDSSPSSTGGSSINLRGNQNSWVWTSRSSANGTSNNAISLYESLNNAIRLVVLAGGNVGIGTSSPGEKLHIDGNVLLENNNGYYIKNNAGTTCRVGAIDASNQLLIGGASITSMYLTTPDNIYFNAQGAYRATMGANGLKIGDSTPPGYQLHLTIDSAAKPTSNTWTISSDARVKEIVGPYTRGVADIVALQPKQYRLNGAFGSVDDGRVHVSVIAQEAQATWPEMIGTYDHTDKDADDVETVTELLNLNTNELQWALVNAIKELSQRVEALEVHV